MKQYIVITTDGFTQDHCGNEVENCQVIGIFEGEDGEKAIGEAYSYMLETRQFFMKNTMRAYRLHED